MSETTVLRSNAIVTSASIGASKPPLVSAGPALPKVQVKPLPAGPQVQQGQQKPVVMLPPKDSKAAVVTGGLPMLQVKMTNTGPQIDDGRHSPVVINPPRNGLPTIAAGGLPMVQVNMTKAGPQVRNVQTAPQIHAAQPRIPTAAPLLGQPRVARIAAPRSIVNAPHPVQHVQPQLPALSTDQLLLCRHLVDKYLGGLRDQALQEAPEGAQTANTDVSQLAEQTLLIIDRSISIATAIAAEEAFTGEPAVVVEAEAVVADEPVEIETVASEAVPEQNPAPVERPAVGYRVPHAFAPSVGYARPAAQPVAYTPSRATPPQASGGYHQAQPGAGYRQQRNAAMAPRRVPRAGAPLPPVIVKMENGRPQVQNQAAVAEARAAAAEARLTGALADPLPDMSALPVDITGSLLGGTQG